MDLKRLEQISHARSEPVTLTKDGQPSGQNSRFYELVILLPLASATWRESCWMRLRINPYGSVHDLVMLLLTLDIVAMTDNKNLWIRNKSTIAYSLSLAFLLFILKWLELRFVIFDHSFEIYIGFIAVIFTALGIWLALKLSKPKIETVVVEKEVYVTRNDNFVLDTSLVARLDLSKRELEILNLLAQGRSNQEIAEKLFVSISTIKTHNQNIFEKLDVKRRIQAVEKAKSLNLIP